jgi:3-hydroxyacyl-[acyl-carrier-protein] dehydratase
MRFVLIDRFLEIVPGTSAVAIKTFRKDEDFFADHFPGFPVVPGALIAEAMGQTAGWLLAYSSGFRDWPLLNMMDRVKLRRFVRAEEEIRISARIRSARERDFEASAEAEVAGRRVAGGRFLFHTFSPDEMGGEGDAAGFRSWTAALARDLFAGLPDAPIAPERERENSPGRAPERRLKN